MSMNGGPNLGAQWVIRGDSSDGVRAANEQNRAFAALSQSVANNWYGLQQLGTAFAALPAAVGAGLGMAVKSVFEFQDAMFEVGRSVGDYGEVQEELGNGILRLARTIPIATTALAELVAQGAQLGVEDENLTSWAKTMGTFIAVTDAGTAGVTDLAKIMNIFQTPEGAIESLSNVVIELGRNTAATEKDILNITRRLAPAAGAVGFTEAKALALGTALISLGPRAEAGGTAINKTLGDMTRAVAGTTEGIETFANVSGKGIQEFADLFRNDASAALNDFITGLGQLDGTQQVLALDELGIKESRQVLALQALAAGTKDYGNSQRDLNQITEDSIRYQIESTAAADALEAKSKTLSGQVQILRNIWFEFGNTLGELGAGPIGVLVDFLGDLLIGLVNLPPELQIIAGLIVVTTVAFAALASILLSVGSRAAMISLALRNVSSAASGSVPAISASTAALNLQIDAFRRLMGFMAAYTGAMHRATGAAATFAGATGLGSVAASSATAATGLRGLLVRVGSMSKFVKGLGIAGTIASLALTGIGIAAANTGNKVRAQSAAAEEATKANRDLALIMAEQGSAFGEASMDFIRGLPAYDSVRDAARKLGIDLLILDSIIQGIATAPQLREFEGAVKRADSDTRESIKNVLTLAKMFEATTNMAGLAGKAVGGFGDEQEEAAASTKKANDALQKQHDLLTQIAEAHVSLVDAIEAQSDAQTALEDAQRNYEDVLRETSDQTDELADAEDELASARISHRQALDNLADAEKQLGDARANAIEKVQDAEDSLLDSQDKYLDTQDKIKDLEQEINDLRGENFLDQIRDATNRLADAQLRLARAHTSVEDAEWHLQHLREEGASARDIQDAEQALAESRQEVANVQDALIDSTKELDDLRTGNTLQDLIAQKERQLASAYRDSRQALQDIKDKEEELSQARTDLANDTAYRDALNDVYEANIAVRDSVRDIADAERQLAEVQSGVEARLALRDASEQLSDAVRSLADANVEVLKQQTLANGGTWDAADAARALARELGNLYEMVPDDENRKALEDYIRILSDAPKNIPDAPDGSGGGGGFSGGSFGLPTIPEVIDHVEGIFDAIEEASGPDRGASTSWWERNLGGFKDFWDEQTKHTPQILKDAGNLGWDLGSSVVSSIGSFFSGNIFGGDLAEKLFGEKLKRESETKIKSSMSSILGVIQGTVEDIEGKAQPQFQKFGRSVIGGFDLGATTQFENTTRGIFGKIPGDIKKPFEGSGELLKFAGRDTIVGLGYAASLEMQNNTKPFFERLTGVLSGSVRGADTALNPQGRSLISGLAGGVDSERNARSNWFYDIAKNIANGIANPDWESEEIGRNIIRGVERGIDAEVEYLMGQITGVVHDMIARVNAAAGISSPSKEFAKIGSYMMLGWVKGINDNSSSPTSAAVSVAEDTIRAALAQVDQQTDAGRSIIDSVISGMEGQFSQLDQALVAARAIIEDNLSRDFASGGIGDFLDGLMNKNLTSEYINGIIADMQGDIRGAFAASRTGLSNVGSDTSALVGSTGTTNETLMLQAVTNADPAQIMNEYVWAKRVRLRGGV